MIISKSIFYPDLKYKKNKMEFLLDVITWSLGWVIFYPENNGWWDGGWFVVTADC